MEKRIYQLQESLNYWKEEEYFSKIDENFKGNIVRQNLKGKPSGFSNAKLVLVNNCLVDILKHDYVAEIRAIIYNSEDSIDKIEETKSLLEKKTGYKFIPSKI